MNKKSIVLTITTLLSFSGVASAEYVIKFNHSQSKGLIPEKSQPSAYSSCKDALEQGNTASGLYVMDINGKQFDAYCDMASAGGGWTMVAAQFESNPASNWNEGIQSDYDPSLSSGKTFLLNDLEVPSHTQTAFGKDFDATYVDYFNYVYNSSGEVNRVSLVGLKANENYRIQRNFYKGPDYCNTYNSNSSSNKNQFALDKESGTHYSWCFDPAPSYYHTPGKGMLGNVAGSSESYAWTIWVR